MARGVDALSAPAATGRRDGSRKAGVSMTASGVSMPVRAGAPWWLPPALALAVIVALAAAPLVALLATAGALDPGALLADPWIRRVVRFSLWQATLSTALSIALALPVALALSHAPSFAGRGALVTLFGLSLVIPTIVAVHGIVVVWGGKGWVATLLAPLGVEPFPLYGLGGILLAHVFFNLPLAARVMLEALEAIPDTKWRLAAQLGMGAVARFRLIEWPTVRGPLVATALLVFTLCFTSFAVVMTLGGGPRATTIEVAIYQALRFDFDIARAVALALLQLVLCGALLLATSLAPQDTVLGLGARDTARARWRPTPVPAARALNALFIVSAALFVVAPLAAIVVSATNAKTLVVLGDPTTLRAAANTLLAALAAAVLAVALAVGLLLGARHLRLRLGRERVGHTVQLSGNLILVLPPIVLGTGLFVLLRPVADVFALALVLVVLINALMALPFALRVLEAPLTRAAREHDHLLQSLGIRGWHRWRLVDWPLARRALGFALALAATLSAGDLGAIALFGSDRVQTLPLLLYQRLGSYRLEEAAATAGLLLVFCLVLFAVIQRLVGGMAPRLSAEAIAAESAAAAGSGGRRGDGGGRTGDDRGGEPDDPGSPDPPVRAGSGRRRIDSPRRA